MTEASPQNHSTCTRAAVDAAREFLRAWNIPYELWPDGTITIWRSLDFSDRKLERLPDLSMVRMEKGDFICGGNRLTSLEGAPHHVAGDFYCRDNRLASLEGGPAFVGGNYDCRRNKLTSLQGAPEKFARIDSDFGCFYGWEEIPENLKISPETRARATAAIAAQTVLQKPLALSRRISFKR